MHIHRHCQGVNFVPLQGDKATCHWDLSLVQPSRMLERPTRTGTITVVSGNQPITHVETDGSLTIRVGDNIDIDPSTWAAALSQIGLLAGAHLGEDYEFDYHIDTDGTGVYTIWKAPANG